MITLTFKVNGEDVTVDYNPIFHGELKPLIAGRTYKVKGKKKVIDAVLREQYGKHVKKTLYNFVNGKKDGNNSKI